MAERPNGGRSPKRRRLSRSAEFERVYRQGRSRANRFLVLYAFPRAEDGRAGDDGESGGRVQHRGEGTVPAPADGPSGTVPAAGGGPSGTVPAPGGREGLRAARDGDGESARNAGEAGSTEARQDDGPRLGLSVSRRVGGAVDRSRVKRALREAFWAEAERLPDGSDYVVVARPDARELAEREGMAGVRAALAELVDAMGGLEARR